MRRLFLALSLSVLCGWLALPAAVSAAPTQTDTRVVDCAPGYTFNPLTQRCVAPSPPALAATPSSGPAPLTVTFTAQGLDTDSFYRVQFGDGTYLAITGSASITHTYTSSGTYTTTLQSAPNICAGVSTPCTPSTPTNWTTRGNGTITVGPASASNRPTCQLTAPGNSPGVGYTVNLSWRSTNASGGTITTIGPVGPSGTQGVIPLAPATIYTGTFTGPGGTGTCTVTVGVAIANGGGVTGTPGNYYTGGAGGGTFTGTFGDYTGGTVGDYSGGTVTSGTPNVNGTFSPGSYGGTAPTGVTAPASPTSVVGTPSGSSGGNIGNRGLLSCVGAGDCNLCTFGSTFQNIINFLLGLSIPIAAGMFSYAAWLYFSNRENAAQIQRAHRIFWTVLVGFIIALMAWLVVQTILRVLVPGYTSWNYTDPSKCSGVRPGANGNFSTIGDVLQQAVGTPQQAPQVVVPVTTYNYNGTAQSVVVCQSGSSYSTAAQNCVNGDGEVTAPISDTAIANGGCPAGATPNGFSCTVCYDQGTADQYCEDVSPTVDFNNTDCSATNIQQAAASGGYTLTQAQANTLSCIAVPESACGRNTSTATTPTGQVTSATGMFQIVMGYNDTCHNLNISSCSQAAQAAGYTVSGDLNCSQHFRGGVPIDATGQACKAAAANITCNASAAACLVQKNPTYSDWTADSRSSAQARCIQQYN